MSQAFHDAREKATGTMHRELREVAAERKTQIGETRATYYREGFAAGHEKGFEAGWLAAQNAARGLAAATLDRRYVRAPGAPRLSTRGLKAMALEVCAPFNPERAMRAK